MRDKLWRKPEHMIPSWVFWCIICPVAGVIVILLAALATITLGWFNFSEAVDRIADAVDRSVTWPN